MDEQKSQRREHILGVAEKLFQHYGFAKTTVADIAREAQVGVGTVYLEFNSKAAIASELSMRRHDCVLSAMRQAAYSDGSFADRLLRMFSVKLERLAEFADSGPHGQELIRGACRATDKAHSGFREAQERLFAEFLQAGAAAGEFEKVEPRTTARVLLSVLHTLASPSNQGLDRAWVDETMRAEIGAACDLVLRGLLKRNE